MWQQQVIAKANNCHQLKFPAFDKPNEKMIVAETCDRGRVFKAMMTCLIFSTIRFYRIIKKGMDL